MIALGKLALVLFGIVMIAIAAFLGAIVMTVDRSTGARAFVWLCAGVAGAGIIIVAAAAL